MIKDALPFHVSDHMLLRYMERMLGVDIEDFRRRLHAKLLPYAIAGVKSAELDGMVIQFKNHGGLSVVAATMWPIGSLPAKQRPPKGDHSHPEGRHIGIRKRMAK